MSISAVKNGRASGRMRRAIWPLYRHRQMLQDIKRQRFEDEQVTSRFIRHEADCEPNFLQRLFDGQES
jgi:hypothetical protein